jgi:hypothetical protein
MPHTPEPWINDDGLVAGRESRERFQPGASHDIFDAHEWPDELLDEALANADLIAAAPDLLAAVEAVLAIGGGVNRTDPPRKLDEAMTWRQQEDLVAKMCADAAAKARGQ